MPRPRAVPEPGGCGAPHPEPDGCGAPHPASGPGPEAVVWAFGGVVWERDGFGITRMAVVHRPKYDDWSFPKGKVDPGEVPEDTARREVEEETGLGGSLGPYLGELRYPLGEGVTKVVGYWAMRPVTRRLRPADAEIDEVQWWTAGEAARRLTHGQDRDLLARFLQEVPEAGGGPGAGASRPPRVTPAEGRERRAPS